MKLGNPLLENIACVYAGNCSKYDENSVCCNDWSEAEGYCGIAKEKAKEGKV